MQDSGLCKVQIFAWAKPKLMPAIAPIQSGAGKQILRIMKLTAIIILAACLQVSAKGYSQKITLSIKDAPLEQVFKSIEKQSGFYFNYVHEQIKQAHPVSIQVKDASLEVVLVSCFRGQPLEYTVVNTDKLIIIKEKKQLVFTEPEKQGQNSLIDVSGKVNDGEGRPLAGANVKIKGTNLGTTTDNEGRFTINNVDENAVLEISFVGFDVQTVFVRGKRFFTITLNQKLSILDETVVIAYGTTSRRFATGNVSTVKAADIEKRPVQNPLLALQGRVPGVEVTQSSGLNGAAVQVRIQGNNSIGSISIGALRTGTDPLIVIDGIPYPTTLYSSGLEGIVQGGSPLNYINPADIESIDVLKDADATSIYGSRAANGAILITTKKGKAGRTTFSVNLQQGWGKVPHKVDMMNTRQYLDMRYEAYKNAGTALSTEPVNSSNYDLKLWDTTRYTDWQKVLIGGTAQYNNINAGMSGGNTNLQYSVKGSYNRRTTVFPGRFDNKVAGLHFNMNVASNDQRFRMLLTGSYMYDQNHLGDDLTGVAVKLEPNAPSLFTDNGVLNWAPDAAGKSSWVNPLASSVNSDFFNTTKNLVTNAVLIYQILPGLKLSSSVGYTDLRSDLYNPFRLETERPERRATAVRTAYFGNRSMSTWIIEPQLSYSGRIGKGKLETLIGTTIQKSSSFALSISGSGFASDLLMKSLFFATTTSTVASASEFNRFNALFGRLNYNWAGKYLLNITARRDGSNKFGDANKFHNFWSVGAGGSSAKKNGYSKTFVY